MIHFIFALFTTIIVEFLILWFFIKNDYKKLFFYSLLINSFTLPLATYFYQNIFHDLYIIEISVILVESILIMLLLEIKYKKAFLFSLIANSFTALIGFLISI